eukprot:scaffold1596_cov302-Pinguiococcus_pyrenoidosus.AAC.5
MLSTPKDPVRHIELVVLAVLLRREGFAGSLNRGALPDVRAVLEAMAPAKVLMLPASCRRSPFEMKERTGAFIGSCVSGEANRDQVGKLDKWRRVALPSSAHLVSELRPPPLSCPRTSRTASGTSPARCLGCIYLQRRPLARRIAVPCTGPRLGTWPGRGASEGSR